MPQIVKIIGFWFGNARAGALPVSVMPALVAFAMGVYLDLTSVALGLFAIIGVAFCHLSVNLLDDYFDYQKRSAHIRQELTHRGIRARVGKCEYLINGKATTGELRKAVLIFALLGAVCGVVIFAFRGMNILYIVAVAAIIGFSYSGGFLKLSYRGLGNIAMWVMSGPLVMIGTYYSAAGVVSSSVVLASIPVGLLAANNTFVHDIMDYEPDKEVGRVTLATLLGGSKKAKIISLGMLLSVSYGIIIIGVAAGSLSPVYLSVLLSLPMATALLWLMVSFLYNPSREYSPAVWMGPMPKTQVIEESGIGWFLVRWFLARNLLMFFCLILVASSFFA